MSMTKKLPTIISSLKGKNMHTLYVYDRTGFFAESEWEDVADLKDYVRGSISKFMLDEHYNVVVELQFNRVQIWDDEGQIFEYKWFEQDN